MIIDLSTFEPSVSNLVNLGQGFSISRTVATMISKLRLPSACPISIPRPNRHRLTPWQTIEPPLSSAPASWGFAPPGRWPVPAGRCA